METILDIILHLDKYLGSTVIPACGIWTYVILFAVIFLETGVIVTPFLPGDSLLFVAGALFAAGATESLGPNFIWIAAGVMAAAAIIGDTVNYHIGKAIGHKLFNKPKNRFFNKKNLVKAHEFYERHGGKTIVLARFIPVIRDFAPFVAGMGVMNYRRFIIYNVAGAIAWVAIGTVAGYYFGNIPFVKDNFSLVIIAIVVISCIPMIVSFINGKIKAAKAKKEARDTVQAQGKSEDSPV
jgi:membrane-associated protein